MWDLLFPNNPRLSSCKGDVFSGSIPEKKGAPAEWSGAHTVRKIKVSHIEDTVWEVQEDKLSTLGFGNCAARTGRPT